MRTMQDSLDELQLATKPELARAIKVMQRATDKATTAAQKTKEISQSFIKMAADKIQEQKAWIEQLEKRLEQIEKRNNV
jgi:hypothetical protein